jgi:hypothetical protein
MSQTSDKRKEIEAGLIAMAKSDPDFRQALLRDPQSAIERRIGAPLPNSARLIVVEETATTNYLVLPAVADDALSDADLESVAGGTDRKKAGMDSLQKFLDIVRSMNPQI